jgi:hypothetical protein
MFSEFSLTWPVGVLKSIQKIESAPSKPLSMIFSGLDFGLCVISVLTYSTRLSLPLALFFDFFFGFHCCFRLPSKNTPRVSPAFLAQSHTGMVTGGMGGPM